MAAVDADEVVTGEAVALDVQPAGLLLRMLGAAIDVAVQLVVLALLVAALAAAGPAPEVLGIVAVALFAFVAVLLPAVVEAATGGRSLGKLAVGARIVRSDGGAAGPRQAAIRALVGVLEIWLTLGVVAALTGIFTPRAQRLGDLVAGTYAQRTRAQPVPERIRMVPEPLAAWAAAADVAAVPVGLNRRIARFLDHAQALEPSARARWAATLAAEAAQVVSPVPAADPETFLRAVVAVRFARERAAVAARDGRAAALSR